MLNKYLIFFLIISVTVNAQVIEDSTDKALPTIEAGVGLFYGQTPHYPGSDQKTDLFLPLPTFIYRGENLRAERGSGLRNRFLYNDRYELNISIGGSLAVSNENDERTGMPELDTIIEVGPGLRYHLINKKDHPNYRLTVNIPIRLAISTDFDDTFARGFTFHPFLYGLYKFNDHYSFFHGITARWATRDYHKYIYDIESKYATPTRKSYESKPGHVQMTYALGLLTRFNEIQFFTVYMLSDASANANSNSPLFVQAKNHTGVVGLVWWFYSKA